MKLYGGLGRNSVSRVLRLRDQKLHNSLLLLQTKSQYYKMHEQDILFQNDEHSSKPLPTLVMANLRVF